MPKSLKNIAGIVAITTLISKLFGLLRSTCIAAAFGVGAVINALNDAKTPFHISGLNIVLNVALDYFLVPSFGISGLVFASMGANLFDLVQLSISAIVGLIIFSLIVMLLRIREADLLFVRLRG